MKKFFVALFMLLSVPAFATGVASTASTADCNNATLNTYTGTSNLSAGWQPNTIDLHWYNGDTEITSGVQTSCVYDGTLTPPATIPTKTGYTFKGWTVRGLPDGYTRLQYIESTGTQYIDTGIKGTLNTKVVLDFQIHNYNDSGYILGGRTSKNTRAFLIGSNSGHFVNTTFPFAQFDTVAANNVRQAPNFDLNRHIYELSSDGFYIDGTLYTTFSNPVSFSTAENITLFGRYNAGTFAYGAFKSYSLKIYENNNFIRNFIPAKRDSDNVVGMWDTVTKTFFTNAGTGSFIAGPVAQ